MYKKILDNKGVLLSLMLPLMLTVACTSLPERLQPVPGASACYIIYDAGSSATRLFIYQETESGWVKHKGPETTALADPVRVRLLLLLELLYPWIAGRVYRTVLSHLCVAQFLSRLVQVLSSLPTLLWGDLPERLCLA